MKLNHVSTVVGSFPYEKYSEENMIKGLELQIRAGVDYPCYPQLVPMVGQFLDPLAEKNPNIKKQDKVYKLEKFAFEFPEEPLATEYGEFMLKYFKEHPEAKGKVKGMKACLTGPFTIANDIIIPDEIVPNKVAPVIYQEQRAIMFKEILLQIADYMANIAKAYSEMGFNIISMDDPLLSLIVGKRKTLFHSDDDIIEILNRALAGVKSYSSIHICGRISPRLADILVKCDVSIMDHEFTTGDNDNSFAPGMFQGKSKTLAIGVIDSNVKYQEGATLDQYVESVDVIVERIKKYQEKFGKENIMFKPDCGFGGLWDSFKEGGQYIVENKLKNLREAMDRTK